MGILADPGFEGGYARGPNDGELPIFTGASGVSRRSIIWPSTYPNIVESIAPGGDISPKYPWVQEDELTVGGTLDNSWRDTSTSHTGSHGSSFDFGAVVDAFSSSPRLYPVGIASCATDRPPGQVFGIGDQFGWVTRPGHQIKLSIWARTSAASGGAGLRIGCEFFADFKALSEVTGPGSDPPLQHIFADTAWTLLTRNVFAPSEAVIAQPYVVARRGAFPTTFFGKVFVDDAGLTLAGGTSAPGFEVTTDVEFDVALRFSGQTFKGYSNIHLVGPKEAPTKVVLV